MRAKAEDRGGFTIRFGQAHDREAYMRALEANGETLLACARRCEASDKSFRSDRAFELIEAIDVYVDDREVTPDWYVHVGQLTIELRAVARILLDNAIKAESERDALAKRVGELEATNERLSLSSHEAIVIAKDCRAESTRLRTELDAAQRREIAAHNAAGGLTRRCEDAERRVRSTATNRELDAIHELDAAKTTNTRLRAENERLARRDGHLCDLVHAHEKALTAAQERVRELEAERAKVQAAAQSMFDGNAESAQKHAKSHRGQAAASARDVARYILEQFAPITTPTQGVGTLAQQTEGAFIREQLRTGRKPNGEPLDPPRPSCIPADCQHYIELPGGLWAWVEGEEVFVRYDSVNDFTIASGSCTFEVFRMGFAPYPGIERVTEPDFLAARALGVRVLGWKSSLTPPEGKEIP
jgi:hypothetical protein